MDLKIEPDLEYQGIHLPGPKPGRLGDTIPPPPRSNSPFASPLRPPVPSPPPHPHLETKQPLLRQRPKRKTFDDEEEEEEYDKIEDCKHPHFNFDDPNEEEDEISSEDLQQSYFYMNLKQLTESLNKIFKSRYLTQQITKHSTRLAYMFSDPKSLTTATRLVKKYDSDAVVNTAGRTAEIILSTSNMKKVVGREKAAILCSGFVVVTCIVLFIMLHIFF